MQPLEAAVFAAIYPNLNHYPERAFPYRFQWCMCFTFTRRMKNPKTTLMLLCVWFCVSCSDSDDHNANQFESSSVAEYHPAVAHLNSIVIPKVDISDATPEEAFDFVRYSLMAHDTESDPSRKGVSMIIRGAKREGDIDQDDDLELGGIEGEKITRITFSSENVAYFDLVTEVARQAQMDAYLTSVGFMIIPEGALPFPNAKAAEGEIWKAIRKTQKP